ncbi:protein priA [Mycena amicta]|nr:protein priA [Mycena amicta]
MTLMSRFGAALVILAAALPFAASSTASRSQSCKSNEFWYEQKSCCLPHGGAPTPPSPPKGHDCPPSSHYWNTGLGCCTPNHPSPPNNPPPQCRDGWTWYPNLYMCLPSPPSSPPSVPPSQPSGGYGNPGSSHGWKRHNHKRSAPLCPTGSDACPISGSALNDYECIDTAVELESCGGCASLGQGQDCTAIPGAWNVGCEQGRCAVYTCTFGFKRSSDGNSCIPL